MSSPQDHITIRHRLSTFDDSVPDSPVGPGGAAVAATPSYLLSVHSPLEPSLEEAVGNPIEPHTLSKHSATSFRNVSACYRCRLRKNKCDQLLPSCIGCSKANVPCVGYDAITKKAIPRSYVFYLEIRIEQLENLLRSNCIPYPPSEPLDLSIQPVPAMADAYPTRDRVSSDDTDDTDLGVPFTSKTCDFTQRTGSKRRRCSQGNSTTSLVSPSKLISLASTSGVSFARVVMAAVQHSAGSTSLPAGMTSPCSSRTSIRDSFFGLHTKPAILPAPFPDQDAANRLVYLFFQHANPQIPILHRTEFNAMFDRAYHPDQASRVRGPRELYMLNMVFAIGAGAIIGEPVGKKDRTVSAAGINAAAAADLQLTVSILAQPENYHASAMVHLDACLSNDSDGLEMLQVILLLANFALMRPVPPGLWYIVGVALRLAVDLNLHQVPSGTHTLAGAHAMESEYICDKKRRLWWSTYSLDRLVSLCVGRPFGISDFVITTDFPSLLDDEYITPDGLFEPVSALQRPSYKTVAFHYFRLRLLQSEILQVLQYNHSKLIRARSSKPIPHDVQNGLASPYLAKFDSFRSWRNDIDRRLLEWRTGAPTRRDTGVAFTTDFLELNYWQTIILLYRQSLSVPDPFESEYDTSNEVNSPKTHRAELREDEDRIYLKIAEAGQKILRLYRLLHLGGVVSYTYLTTHHLFIAGISYLYALWHSPLVRSQLTMDEVDLSILAARSVFTDLMDKCPPAETCRDAFDRTARATVKMAMAAGGFSREPEESNASKLGKGQRRRIQQRQVSHKAEFGLEFSVQPPIPIKSEPSPMMTTDLERYAVMPPPQRHGRPSPPGLTLHTQNPGFGVDMLLPSQAMGDEMTYGSHNVNGPSGVATPLAPYVTASGFGGSQQYEVQDPRSMNWLHSGGVNDDMTSLGGATDPFCWDGMTHQLAESQFGWFYYAQSAGSNPVNGPQA